jgi:hypothetical protein
VYLKIIKTQITKLKQIPISKKINSKQGKIKIQSTPKRSEGWKNEVTEGLRQKQSWLIGSRHCRLSIADC